MGASFPPKKKKKDCHTDMYVSKLNRTLVVSNRLDARDNSNGAFTPI